MKRLCLALITFASLIPWPATAFSQISPPVGWAMERTEQGLVFTYPGIQDDARVVYQVRPVAQPEGEASSWFAKQAEEIANALGDDVEPLTVSASATSSMAVIGFTVTSDGERLVVLVCGYPVGQRFQMLVVVGPQTGEQLQTGGDQLAAALAEDAMRHAERLAFRLFALTPDMIATGLSPQQPPRRTGRGIGSSRIEDVLVWYWGGANSGPSGGMKMTTYLLLKDGRVFVEEPASPVDFDPASRPLKSWGVGAWTKARKGYVFRWPTEAAPAPSDEYFRAVRAPENYSLSGVFRLVGAGIGIGVAPDDWQPTEGLSVAADGRLKGIHGALYEPDDLGPGWSKPAYGPEFGYSISGRTVLLTHPDGREERRLFSILGPVREPLGFIIGDAVYQRLEP